MVPGSTGAVVSFLFIFFFFPSVLIAYFGMGCMGTGYYRNVLYTIESLQDSI
jgi:hypothetical protein